MSTSFFRWIPVDEYNLVHEVEGWDFYGLVVVDSDLLAMYAEEVEPLDNPPMWGVYYVHVSGQGSVWVAWDWMPDLETGRQRFLKYHGHAFEGEDQPLTADGQF